VATAVRDTRARASCARPLVILSAPRSFSSVISTMLGQHPETFALPETNLFSAPTLGEWWRQRDALPWHGAGLLRSVAELRFGGQSQRDVERAGRWMLCRAEWSTAAMFRSLRSWVQPRMLIEASPRTSLHPAQLARLRAAAPHARYLHLVRAPADQAASLERLMTPPHLLTVPPRIAAFAAASWRTHEGNIDRFLRSVPDADRLRVEGERVLEDPDGELWRIARWLGLADDAAAIEAMKHPEASPFATVGPPGARFGNDPSFLRDPVLRMRGPARPTVVDATEHEHVAASERTAS
jgi:sulfotransferase family protein